MTTENCTWISLLRGINVGGHKKLPMPTRSRKRPPSQRHSICGSWPASRKTQIWRPSTTCAPQPSTTSYAARSFVCGRRTASVALSSPTARNTRSASKPPPATGVPSRSCSNSPTKWRPLNDRRLQFVGFTALITFVLKIYMSALQLVRWLTNIHEEEI